MRDKGIVSQFHTTARQNLVTLGPGQPSAAGSSQRPQASWIISHSGPQASALPQCCTCFSGPRILTVQFYIVQYNEQYKNALTAAAPGFWQAQVLYFPQGFPKQSQSLNTGISISSNVQTLDTQPQGSKTIKLMWHYQMNKIRW